MDFDEFIKWATGYVLIGIGEGRTLKYLMHVVINYAVRNKIFGKCTKS